MIGISTLLLPTTVCLHLGLKERVGIAGCETMNNMASANTSTPSWFTPTKYTTHNWAGPTTSLSLVQSRNYPFYHPSSRQPVKCGDVAKFRASLTNCISEHCPRVCELSRVFSRISATPHHTPHHSPTPPHRTTPHHTELAFAAIESRCHSCPLPRTFASRSSTCSCACHYWLGLRHNRDQGERVATSMCTPLDFGGSSVDSRSTAKDGSSPPPLLLDLTMTYIFPVRVVFFVVVQCYRSHFLCRPPTWPW
jgi:hypothetical protein